MVIDRRIRYAECMIHYRPLTTIDEFEQVSALEILIWGLPELYAIAPHTIKVILHAGGCLIGALEDERVIGFVIGLARRDDRLWSHIAAVHPDYQRQGIGYQLKHTQREWAREQGFTHMHWTFDPLLRVNAHFNLHQLGAYAQTYHANFYGQMLDGINAGLPSDRLQVTWDIIPQTRPATPPDADAPLLLEADADGYPRLNGPAYAPWHRVQVPQDMAYLRAHALPTAQAWRLAQREVLQTAFAQGYRAVDFVKGNTMSCYYLLLS